MGGVQTLDGSELLKLIWFLLVESADLGFQDANQISYLVLFMIHQE